MKVKVYLVQHAEAMDAEVDPDRPLSDKGKRHAKLMASVLEKVDPTIYQVRHSGKTRARQTAEILGDVLALPGGVVKVEGLSPLDDVHSVVQELAVNKEPFMFVGHLPFLERLTSALLVDDAERKTIDFQNAGIVCLQRGEPGTPWSVAWVVTPKVAEKLLA
jgi:phosphohistidine phosphatase